MIIEPIIDKKTGKPITNVKVVRNMYAVLSRLKNPPLTIAKNERESMQLEFKRICGGENNAENVYKWVEFIASIEDESEAQRQINLTLLPLK